MRVLFAHPEPIEPRHARWVAILRTLAAVARRAPVIWFTPDSVERVREVAYDHLGLDLPPKLEIRTLASWRKRMGVTINAVFLRAFRKALRQAGPGVLWLRSDKLAEDYAENPAPHMAMVYEAHLVGPLWAQDRGDPENRVAKLRRLEKRLFAGASGVAAITEGLLEEIRGCYGWQGPSAVVPSAVEAGLFRPVWDGGDGCTVAYMGTFGFWKGLETLARAVALAPSLRLRLVGGGKPEEEQALRSLVGELGLTDRVEFLGRLPQTELPEALSEAACAVHPLPGGHAISSRFTSPLKLFEYLALGVPVVASDVPSVREVLADGVNARLVAPDDPAALAQALQEAASDRVLARRLSEAGLEVAAGHTYEARAEKLLELFSRVFSTVAQGPPT